MGPPVTMGRPRAHPRLRGADMGNIAATIGDFGSSPLTRGGLGNTVDRAIGYGLIPAYAGRTVPGYCWGC